MAVPISVITLTKNEENNIADCLESVKWADEIIVVDDHSTDRTLEIAKRYATKVLQHKMDIEGRHRNWAYAQAKNEWVLSLDADERASPELMDEISELLKGGKPEFSGYHIPRRNYIGDYWVRHGGWYPSAQLKLFRKEKFRYEESEVHPRAFMDGGAGSLKSDIIHYSYKDFTDFIDKINKQTDLEAQKWFRTGRNMTLGKALWRTVDRFFRSYIGKKGFRDAFVGFIVAIFASLYQLLSYAKFREMRRKTDKGTEQICL